MKYAAGHYPIGGIACVGIRSVSFANIAESDKSPLALFMSATCSKCEEIIWSGEFLRSRRCIDSMYSIRLAMHLPRLHI